VKNLKSYLAAVCLLAVAITAGRASADLSHSAIYEGTAQSGVITVTGPVGQNFAIRAEQPSGSYALIYSGTLGTTSTASVNAVPSGILGNDTPPFIVVFFTPSQPVQAIPVYAYKSYGSGEAPFAGEPEPDDGHWLW
jgi:hypothetical protein